jgi:hypothetical protein
MEEDALAEMGLHCDGFFVWKDGAYGLYIQTEESPGGGAFVCGLGGDHD